MGTADRSALASGIAMALVSGATAFMPVPQPPSLPMEEPPSRQVTAQTASESWAEDISTFFYGSVARGVAADGDSAPGDRGSAARAPLKTSPTPSRSRGPRPSIPSTGSAVLSSISPATGRRVSWLGMATAEDGRPTCLFRDESTGRCFSLEAGKEEAGWSLESVGEEACVLRGPEGMVEAGRK